MGTINISLPGSLKTFVEDQVAQGSYGSASEYVRDLIRKDQDRWRLRNLLLEGAASAPSEPVGPLRTAAGLLRALRQLPEPDPAVLDRLDENQSTDLPPEDLENSD